MSEPALEPPSEPPPSEPPPTPRAAPILSGRRGAAAVGFATALIVFGLLVVTAPFWTPAVIPLLTGGAAPVSADAALSERLAQLGAARRDDQQRTDQAIAAAQKTAADLATALQQLDRRIAALENKPAAAPGDVAELRQQLRALETRATTPPAELSEIRQGLQRLATANADLTSRIAALEKGEQTQSASDATDTALLLAVLQIREAIETGRPFAAEDDALAALAKSRPDVAAAAAPLAEPAKSGVASRAVLIERLRALAGTIAAAQPIPAEAGWRAHAWAQLRGLITIRRIDGAGQSAPEAAVNAAERSLAAGDLASAVAALDPLTGPAAEAARPWLQMARQRLAAETALRQIEALLVARLGAAR